MPGKRGRSVIDINGEIRIDVLSFVRSLVRSPREKTSKSLRRHRTGAIAITSDGSVTRPPICGSLRIKV